MTVVVLLAIFSWSTMWAGAMVHFYATGRRSSLCSASGLAHAVPLQLAMAWLVVAVIRFVRRR